jgi:hypothetical protein
MIPDRIKIWTPRGYTHAGDLTPGDKVLSYNPSRGCTEYDTITMVQTDWRQLGLMGLKQASIFISVTPDHPLLIINPYTKELSRIPVEELFLKNGGKYKTFLTNKPFEPFKQNNSLEDVEWTARLAVSTSRFNQAPLYWDIIEPIIRDITALEARAWLNTFFHWNILRRRTQYMKTCLLRNEAVKAMLYHVAPRAGVGTYYGPFKTKAHFSKWTQALSIAKEGNTNITRLQWATDRHEGIFFKLATRNGNALARFGSSTFPIACDYS